MIKKYNITFYNLLFLIAAVAAIYYNGVNVMIAKYISMAIFAFLFVAAVVKSSKEGIKPIFKKWALWLVLFTLVNMLYGMEPKNWFPQEIAMPLMIAFSSTYLFTLDYRQFKKWFIPVGILLSFVAYMAVIRGVGSLVIHEAGGLDVAKNQIGPCFTSIAILSYVFFIEKDTRFWERIVLGAATILNLYPALYLGCRAALLCFFVVAVFTTFKAYRAKGALILAIIGILVMVLFGRNELLDSLYASFVGGRDVNDFSSMTSGRDVNMAESLDYFFRHPLFGFYGSGDGYNVMPANAHIYLLYHITKWGLIGAIPAIALYVSICKIFYHSYKAKDIIVFALLFVAMVESLAEYAPPFGPGSCFTMTYLILGIYLKDNEI